MTTSANAASENKMLVHQHALQSKSGARGNKREEAMPLVELTATGYVLVTLAMTHATIAAAS
ncbi:MAG: hypothetical protein ACREX9_10585, partial [Gammaproteobacteria bacterium]